MQEVVSQGAKSIAGRLGTQTFRSLRIRNYRLFFIAQCISSTGTWVQLIAENWLVVRLGGSGLTLGVTTALQFLPILFLSAYAGVLVDRYNRRFVLTITQSIAGLISVILGLLALVGLAKIWMIWVAALLLGW
jgi:MFS family permease